MPTYTYENCYRHTNKAELIERNVPIDDRDDQSCMECGTPLKRKISFTGLTWAPTAGGMR